MKLRPIALPPQGWFPEQALTEKVRRAVWATHQKIQSPLSMVATLAIGVMSEAVQGLVSVQIPHGPLCPTSCWPFVIAETGMGKTPSLNMLRLIVPMLEAAYQRQYQEAMEGYKAEHRAWKLELAEHEQALRNAVRKGLDTLASKKQLTAHMALEPKQPRKITLTYQDVTPEALGHGLYNWPNASHVNDEVAVSLNGHMGPAMAMLNQRWELQPLSIERVTLDKPLFVKDPRVTLNWAIQPAPFWRYMERRGQEARELGTLARFLFCLPDNNQGMRNVAPVEIDPQEMQAFHDRVKSCLQASIGEDGEPLADKKVITFSAEAEARYHRFRANIEQNLLPGGRLENVKDYAAKAPRHLARLAGMFEFFETGSTVISLDIMERAATVMNWYIYEYIRLFAPASAIPQEQLDADRLYPWLQQFAQKRYNRYLIRNDIRKFVPKSELRDAVRLENALAVLQQRSLINRYISGKIAYIDMMPAHPYDPAALTTAIHAYRSSRVKAAPAGMH